MLKNIFSFSSFYEREKNGFITVYYLMIQHQVQQLISCSLSLRVFFRGRFVHQYTHKLAKSELARAMKRNKLQTIIEHCYAI